jgi:hypothetical protein
MNPNIDPIDPMETWDVPVIAVDDLDEYFNSEPVFAEDLVNEQDYQELDRMRDDDA